MPSLKTAKEIRQWMKAAVRDGGYADPNTGEICATGLGQAAIWELDLCHDPDRCPGTCEGCETAFEEAAGVAEWAEDRRAADDRAYERSAIELLQRVCDETEGEEDWRDYEE